MTNITIKLFYSANGIKETTTFEWLNGKAKIVSIEGTDENSIPFSHLDSDFDDYTSEEDTRMVNDYLNICGKFLLETAADTNSTICFTKEVWGGDEFAIVESWLEQNGCTMMKKNIRAEFYNNVLLAYENTTFSI